MLNIKGLLTIVFMLSACSSTISGGPENEIEPSTADARIPSLLADAGPEDPPASTVLSQSTGSPVTNANVNCRYGENGPHTDTRHFRVFPSESIGNSTITEALLPIEVASSPEGSQSATLRFHKLTGTILNGQFELLSEVPFNVLDQVLGEVKVPLNVQVGQGETIVLEVAITDGEEVRNLRFGYNLQTQTAATYLASASCGILLPVDLATLSNPTGGTFAANSWLVSLTIEPTP